jgi:hypothetical protein
LALPALLRKRLDRRLLSPEQGPLEAHLALPPLLVPRLLAAYQHSCLTLAL